MVARWTRQFPWCDKNYNSVDFAASHLVAEGKILNAATVGVDHSFVASCAPYPAVDAVVCLSPFFAV